MRDIKQTGIFRKWESQLRDAKTKAAIAARIARLAYGLSGDVEPVGEGVSELRIHYGPGYRIYFKIQRKTVILLLCGGDKSSQRRDIRLARTLSKQWNEGNDKSTDHI